ncbi:hypothetical protein QTN25_009758 [Entamoeba marina]
MFKTPTFSPHNTSRKRAGSCNECIGTVVTQDKISSKAVTPFAEKEIKQILNKEKEFDYVYVDGDNKHFTSLEDVKWVYDDDVVFEHCITPPPTL